MSAYASVDLPEPFGPMTACTSFGETARSTPLTISAPSSARATCRFFSSSRANVFVLAVLLLTGLRIRAERAHATPSIVAVRGPPSPRTNLRTELAKRPEDGVAMAVLEPGGADDPAAR